MTQLHTPSVSGKGSRLWSSQCLHRVIHMPSSKRPFRLTFTKEPEDKIPIVLDMLYPKQWLDSPAEDDPQGRRNREVEAEVRCPQLILLFLFHRNEFYVICESQSFRRRMTVTRPPTFVGSVSQMAAALTHNVSPERLRQISRTIPKVTIVVGDEDHLVRVNNSLHLKRCMPEAEFVQYEHTGHGLPAQQRRRFNELLERVFAEGRQRVHPDHV